MSHGPLHFLHEVPVGAPGRHPGAMTMHRSKGMEFAKVILVRIGARFCRGHLIDGVVDEDRSDVFQRERSLLYVAANRAR